MSRVFLTAVAVLVLISTSGCYNRYVNPYGYGSPVIAPPGTGSYVIPGQGNPDPYYNNSNPGFPANNQPRLNVNPLNGQPSSFGPSQWSPTGPGSANFQPSQGNFNQPGVVPATFEAQPPMPSVQPPANSQPSLQPSQFKEASAPREVGFQQPTMPANQLGVNPNPSAHVNIIQPAFNNGAAHANVAGPTVVPIDPNALVANPSQRYAPVYSAEQADWSSPVSSDAYVVPDQAYVR